jgi:hypothetical protein
MQTHPDILGVGVQSSLVRHGLALGASVLLAASAAGAAAACRIDAPTRLIERFVPADCERCWSGATPLKRHADALVIDWITPAGDDAAMASAALAEAAARAGPMPAGQSGLRENRLHPSESPRLRIVDGPAWNGYIGLRLLVTRHEGVPHDAVAYAALVEHVPAGTEGSPIERNLVRAVVGPLGLDELRGLSKIEHLRAVAVPAGSRADRLASVAWIEAADGRVMVAAHSPPPECR